MSFRYAVPALIAVAVAAGVTVAARKASQARRKAAGRAEVYDEKFMEHLFGAPKVEIPRQETAPEPVTGLLSDRAMDTMIDRLREHLHDPQAAAAERELVNQDLLEDAVFEEALPRPVLPHPSAGLAPFLPPHLTGGFLMRLAYNGTAVSGLQRGLSGGECDLVEFADGSSLVLMPADHDSAELIGVALAADQPVRLLGSSIVGGGHALTFEVDGVPVYALADRVYARAADESR
jgi:hypothetical protein